MPSNEEPKLETIRLEHPAGGVAVATLDRPDRMNAMTMVMFAELEQLALDLGEQDDLRVLIVTGAGAAFCAGYDLADAAELPGLSPMGMLARQEQAARALSAIRSIRVPVIAAVNGAAAGGGLALALAADIRLASPAARFNAAFVRIGLSAGDLGTSWLLPRLIGDGHSNLTFLVSDGRRRVVVRMPPALPLPPGAHDVLREATLMRALAGSAVPVPAVLASAEAGQVIDAPFYVMDYVPGPVATTATPPALSSPADRRRIGEALTDTLVSLHAVDWPAAGLAGLGRPEGFNARHLRRMGALVADEQSRPPPDFAEIDAWLGAHVPPESGASIVHNDYRLGNVILAPEPPGRIAAVLDWELATIGDPLFNLGYFLASYPVPDEPLTPTGAMGTAVLEPGYPSRAELAQRYAAATWPT